MDGVILGLICIAAGLAVYLLGDWLIELSIRAYENDKKEEDV